jgi:MYXO-CTERM domain-containing protein
MRAPRTVPLLLVSCIAVAASSFAPRPARAATFTPACPGGVGDPAALVAAITTANTNGQDDAIVLAANCTYTLGTVNDTSAGSTGLPAVLTDSGHTLRISGNGATFTRDATGPAFRFLLVSGGVLVLTDLVLSGGMTDPSTGTPSGGAVLVETGLLETRQVTFASNIVTLSSAGSGGAVAVENGGLAAIVQSTASSNLAPEGGAFSCAGGTLVVANSTIASNMAGMVGGGIVLSSGTATLTNVTVANNAAGNAGSGIDALAGMFTLTNTVVANNGGGSPSNLDAEGTFTDGGHNLIGATAASFGPTTLAGTSGAPIRAGLGSLANNGGPTKTMSLNLGSPAIGAGDTGACTMSPVSGIDQRGVARPTNMCDIGAYEATVTVPPDAGSDASAGDAGLEGGSIDGGVDGGIADGGVEGGIADAGVEESGSPDAGVLDGGTAAAADGGVDAALTDSGAVVDGSGSVTVDASAMKGAEAGTAADLDASADASDDGGSEGTVPGSDSGCGCRVTRTEPADFAVTLLALALLGRRRRRV